MLTPQLVGRQLQLWRASNETSPLRLLQPTVYTRTAEFVEIGLLSFSTFILTTTSSPAPPPSSSSSGSGTDTGAIVGIVISCVVIVILLVLAVRWERKRKSGAYALGHVPDNSGSSADGIALSRLKSTRANRPPSAPISGPLVPGRAALNAHDVPGSIQSSTVSTSHGPGRYSALSSGPSSPTPAKPRSTGPTRSVHIVNDAPGAQSDADMDGESRSCGGLWEAVLLTLAQVCHRLPCGACNKGSRRLHRPPAMLTWTAKRES
jgi:hypothetical protein